jgi:shikimate kinase
MKIFLIGYRCTGKTTVGRILARYLNFDFIDMDLSIEQKTRLTVSQIVEKYGWDKFRLLETKTLLDTKHVDNAVIATGGGVVTAPDNLQFMKNNGFCIWLDAKIKTILKRLKNDAATALLRPPLTDNNLIEESKKILNQRNPLYKKIANIRIDTTILTPEEIVGIIDRRLEHDRQQHR